VVSPGDLIIADESGVVAVSRGRAQKVLEEARAKEARSAKNMERVRNGERLGDCSGATAMVLTNLADKSQS
jgi:regulator of RNase E activity RraA